jgi:RHS repeat-associated protein
VNTDRLGPVRRGGGYAGEKATYDYAMNRYYAPQWGRFTTPDPYPASAQLANPQSWNRYSYVENDPVNRTDRSGLFWESASIEQWEAGLVGVEGGSGGYLVTTSYTNNGTERTWSETRFMSGSAGGGGQFVAQPSTAQLLKNSIQSIKERLKKKECAEAIGAKDAEEAIKRVGDLKFEIGNTGGYVLLEPVGSGFAAHKDTPGVANYGRGSGLNPLARRVRLNETINWSDPAKSQAINSSTGTLIDYDLLAAAGHELGARVTATDLMDTVLLHEVGHSFGINHPRANATAYNISIWQNCF